MKEIKWAFSFLGKYKAAMALVWLLGAIYIGLLIVDPLIVSSIVDDILYPMFNNPAFSNKEVLDALIPKLGLAFGIVVFMAVERFLANVLRDYVGQKAIYNIREALYEKVGTQSRRFFMKNRSGDLINKCTGDVEWMRHFVCWVSYLYFESIFMVVIVLSVFFYVNWKFTLCLIAVAPIAFAVAITMGKKVRPVFQSAREQLSKLNTVVAENIAGNRVVRAFCREPYEIKKFNVENELYFDKQLEGNKVWVKYAPILSTIASVMDASAIILGSIFVIKGELSVGELIIFTSLSWMLNNPMQQLGFIINDTQRFMASCERVHELFETEADIQSAGGAVEQPIKGEIEFDNVSMKYEGDEEEILKNISLKIPAGATVGIMGATGSGKSTLINLIGRFEDVTGGAIKIDGVNVKDYDLQYLRKNVAVALQDVFLFSDTVQSNIAYGVPNASESIIVRAAVDADADSFVKRLPEGYQTIVGERG
ncbi:MAG: ABC transporter ATP-binding protein/permease, partial [Lachnospiraceae bacterium]|nr:ABC transporter ATP-binding protein/permease [Lachnospiraceae bacterium]